MKDRVRTLLGFAAKAGKLSFGFAASLKSAERRKAVIILTASDLSEKSRKEIVFHAGKTGTEVISVPGADMEAFTQAVGRKCGIIAVNEAGFAQSLKEEILNDQ